jgi:hypothetical protein
MNRQTELIKYLFWVFAPTHTPTDIQLVYAIKDFNRDHPVHLKEYEKDYKTITQHPVKHITRGGFNGKPYKVTKLLKTTTMTTNHKA